MTEQEKRLAMAYAIGNSMPSGSFDHAKVKLGDLCEDWKDYSIVGWKGQENSDDWFLYYNGAFGNQKAISCIMKVSVGYELRHTIALLMMAIEMHQAELRKQKKET